MDESILKRMTDDGTVSQKDVRLLEDFAASCASCGEAVKQAIALSAPYPEPTSWWIDG
jgi:hypothetical protein